MRRVLAVLVLALFLGLVVDAINVDRTADATALQYAASVEPQAHWTVVRHTFEPWANRVTRGNLQTTGGFGPTWVIELSAPPDSRWKSYSGMVMINAIVGNMWSGNVLASN
jgi:hypothetical protein